MLSLVIFGVAVVVGGYLILRGFVAADPRKLARVLRWTAVVLVVAAVGALALSGRLGTALAMGAFLLPLLTQWRGFLNRLRAARGPSPGQVSEVETLYLRMTLHHDTGAMTGEVRHGPFKGRSLDTLSTADLSALLDECRREDAQSAAVLEAWLDRTRQDDWREAFSRPEEDRSGENRGQGGGRRGGMTRDEALEILGLQPGATAQQIKEAHRRLMMKVHPDHGGSTFLAAKINQAKDLLLNP